jgi:adenosine deaminase
MRLPCLAAFDLASYYYGIQNKKWVRVNILLGAKCHKDENQFTDTVSLLTSYLQKNKSSFADDDSLPSIAPKWWKLSRVVGFDLSGDENSNAASKNIFAKMEPLYKQCANITIHAGEAATAESIWEAVYRYTARRIGHGLRLRENLKLLNYCVTEGIAIELCPISNSLTNIYTPLKNFRMDNHNNEVINQRNEQRDTYPLIYYLEHGLDVCINTDNRQLHTSADGLGSSLTEEYLWAAYLCGGLTRWEDFRIIKAGFKHAFLSKKEIELLLEEAEEQIYRIINRTN